MRFTASGSRSHGKDENLRRESPVLEEIKEPLVDALDGLEKFLNPHGVARYLLCG